MTNTTRLIRIALLGGCLLAAPHWAAAQASCVADSAAKVATASIAEEKLLALKRNDCLGGPACIKAMPGSLGGACEAVNPILGKPQGPQQAADALRAITQATATLAENSEAGERLLTRMGIDLARYVDDGRTAAAQWRFEELILFDGESYKIDVPTSVLPCRGEEVCTTQFVEGQQLIGLATLFGRVLIKAKEDVRNAFGQHLERLDQEWRAYLGSSRGQYPWELALNSALYRKTAAFDAPPTSQWILAHPGAAFELTRNAPDRQPSESLLLELAGIYRWSWSTEAKMRQRLGGSLTMAWRDTGEGRQKLGWGVLVYLPRSSTVGYVWRRQVGDDEHALVLSADLVKFIRGTQGIKERLIGGGKNP